MPPRSDFTQQVLGCLRLEEGERQILQFAANLPHPQPVADGRVDFQSLLRDSLLLLARETLQRAHVVQAVRQLDDDYTDVAGHGQQHLPHALGLAGLGGVEVQLPQFGDAVHATRHLFAEALANLLDAGAGVLHDVVQKARFQRHEVHVHPGQDPGHLDGVDHVQLRPSGVSAGHAGRRRKGKLFQEEPGPLWAGLGGSPPATRETGALRPEGWTTHLRRMESPLSNPVTCGKTTGGQRAARCQYYSRSLEGIERRGVTSELWLRRQRVP